MGVRRWSLAAMVVSAIVVACSGADTAEDPVADEIVLFAPYLDEDADAFRAVLGAFTESTGVPVRYVGTASFAEQVQERVREGDPPDVAVVPQPSIVAELARSGYLEPLPAEVAAAADESYLTAIRRVGRVDDIDYGVAVRASVKSLVWYPPAAFADASYTVPTSWGAMVDLAAQMVDDGLTPWCMGMEAFGATGWVGTDWVEDIVIREQSARFYREWVVGDIPFTDGRIAAAFRTFGDIALTPRQVLGGVRGILSIPALGAIESMVEDPPRCLMSRQASFQEGALPEEVTIGPDGDLDVFVLPPMDGGPAPLVLGVDTAVALDNGEDVAALMEWLAGSVSGEAWAARGDYTSPHRGFDQSTYTREFDRRLAVLVEEASVVVVDGSDQMPPAVGTGSFFTGMVDYVAGTDLDIVLDDIQAAWPEGD